MLVTVPNEKVEHDLVAFNCFSQALCDGLRPSREGGIAVGNSNVVNETVINRGTGPLDKVLNRKGVNGGMNKI